MTAIKKMISFNPLLLQALDAVAKAQKKSRSGLIESACENYPDIWEVLAGMREANKAVSNE